MSGRLTSAEAKRALFEIVEDPEQDEQHLQDVYSQIEELENV